jgi:hypothetical protein
MKVKGAWFWVVAGILISLAGAPSISAHHSFGAEYDLGKPIILHGTVVKWEMINPHSYITVDSVKPGDELTINGYLAKDGSRTMFGLTARLPDGRRVLGGPAPNVSSTPGDPAAPEKKSGP